MDASPNTVLLASGAADNTVRLWNARTAECVKVWDLPTAVKRVEFSPDGTKLLAVTEKRMGYLGTIVVYDIAYGDGEGNGLDEQSDEPTLRITCEESKATVAGWSYFGKYIIAGHEDGSVSQYDPKVGGQREQLGVKMVIVMLTFTGRLEINSRACRPMSLTAKLMTCSFPPIERTLLPPQKTRLPRCALPLLFFSRKGKREPVGLIKCLDHIDTRPLHSQNLQRRRARQLGRINREERVRHSRWWPGRHRRHHDRSATRKIRSAILPQDLRRRDWPCPWPFRTVEHDRRAPGWNRLRIWC